MMLAVPKETYPGERRVALVPSAIKPLAAAGIDVLIESGAGVEAGFSDDLYRQAGAKVSSRGDCLAADIVAQVRCLGANKDANLDDFREGQIVIGMCDPLGSAESVQRAASKGVLVTCA